MIRAIITEAGNGFPEAGDYVSGDDGNLYRVITHDSRIQTGQSPGAGNWIRAIVELADWDDVESDDDVFPASARIDSPEIFIFQGDGSDGYEPETWGYRVVYPDCRETRDGGWPDRESAAQAADAAAGE